MAETVAMTDAWLRRLTVSEGRQEYRDAVTPGLTLRASRLGKKWSVLRSIDGKRKRVQLGAYPDVSLRRAREAASDAAPGMFISSSSNEAGKVNTASARDVIDGYLGTLDGRESYDKVRNALRDGRYAFLKHAAKELGEAPAASAITPAVVTGWLREAHKRSPHFVPDLHGYLHAAFQWAVEADHDPTRDLGAVTFGLDANPVSVVKKGKRRAADPYGKQIPLDELSTFWHRLPDAVEARTVILCRLVIAMGGQRLTEIRTSKKQDWRKGWLYMPQTKAGMGHSIPQTELAKEQLRMAFALAPSESEYLFPNALDISRPMSQEALSKALGKVRRIAGLGEWKLAWLRSTIKTAVLEAELLDERHIDIWQNHGQNADVARRNYDAAEHRMLKQRCALVVDQFLRDVLAAKQEGGIGTILGKDVR